MDLRVADPIPVMCEVRGSEAAKSTLGAQLSLILAECELARNPELGGLQKLTAGAQALTGPGLLLSESSSPFTQIGLIVKTMGRQ